MDGRIVERVTQLANGVRLSHVVEVSKYSVGELSNLSYADQQRILKNITERKRRDADLDEFFPPEKYTGQGLLPIEWRHPGHLIYEKIVYPKDFFDQVRALKPRESVETTVKFGFAWPKEQAVYDSYVKVTFLGCEQKYALGELRNVGFFEVKRPSKIFDKESGKLEIWTSYVYMDKEYSWPVLYPDKYGRNASTVAIEITEE